MSYFAPNVEANLAPTRMGDAMKILSKLSHISLLSILLSVLGTNLLAQVPNDISIVTKKVQENNGLVSYLSDRIASLPEDARPKYERITLDSSYQGTDFKIDYLKFSNSGPSWVNRFANILTPYGTSLMYFPLQANFATETIAYSHPDKTMPEVYKVWSSKPGDTSSHVRSTIDSQKLWRSTVHITNSININRSLALRTDNGIPDIVFHEFQHMLAFHQPGYSAWTSLELKQALDSSPLTLLEPISKHEESILQRTVYSSGFGADEVRVYVFDVIYLLHLLAQLDPASLSKGILEKPTDKKIFESGLSNLQVSNPANIAGVVPYIYNRMLLAQTMMNVLETALPLMRVTIRDYKKTLLTYPNKPNFYGCLGNFYLENGEDTPGVFLYLAKFTLDRPKEEVSLEMTQDILYTYLDSLEMFVNTQKQWLTNYRTTMESFVFGYKDHENFINFINQLKQDDRLKNFQPTTFYQ